jgi:hypothetical protein
VERAQLKELVAQGLSVPEIAAARGVSHAIVKAWMREHRLEPSRPLAATLPRVTRHCRVHGETLFAIRSDGTRPRCLKCRSEAVTRRRRRVKQLLVEQAGGACVVCGYSRLVGALAFHHVDPNEKRFAMSVRGVARSLERAQAEAAKCVLLCANCHAEVEAGVATLPSLPIQSP